VNFKLHPQVVKNIDFSGGTMKTALVTGASAGLGRALTATLAQQGWTVIVDARGRERLAEAVDGLGARVHAVPGDITDPQHRERLVRDVTALGRLDLLVNNASTLGQTPLPALVELDLDAFDDTWLTNVMAPLALTQALVPLLVAGDRRLDLVRCRGRALPRLGCLRRHQGSTRPPDTDSR
jgi:NAD(P)-dependent dehydrogenase (short-subunit alcohol dehydrogenase family)